MRRSLALVAAIVPLSVLLAACGGGAGGTSSTSGTPSSSPSASVNPAANSAILDSVKVTPGTAGKAPKVEFSAPLKLEQPAIKVVSAGTGAVIADGQVVQLHAVTLSAADGKVLADDYAKTPTTVVVDQSFKQSYGPFYDAFVGAKVGSQIAYAIPAQQQNGQTQAAQLAVYYLQAAKPAPTKAAQSEVDQLDSAGKLPTVSFDAKQVPSVKIPAVDAPDNLIVKVLKPGTGEALKATDKINANYSGWTWGDGKQFDSSYTKGQPVAFGLNEVIPGWTQGLTGQKIGSTVLLVIPTPLAYPDASASNGKPAGPLVFVVNIASKA